MNKFSVILITMTFLLPLSLLSQGYIVETFTGEKYPEFFSTTESIKFPNNNLFLDKTDSPTYYNLISVKKIYFDATVNTTEVSEIANFISVYPNPASSVINLSNIKDESVVAKIYNIEGKLLQTKRVSAIDNKIDINDLLNGYYILRINGKTLKFIKL
jgi:hypothetical protein